MTSPHSITRFVVLCALYWAAGLAAVALLPGIEEAAIGATLAALHLVFGAAGIEVARAGDTLIVGGTGVRIVADCSPHVPWLLFAGAVLAFPAAWPQRLAGLAAGVAAIHVFNVVRIAGLIGVLARWPEWFEFAHVYLWQTGTLLMIVVSFTLWLRWTRPRSALHGSA